MTTIKQMPKMIKTPEAAKILRVTPATLRNWVDEGLVKCGKTLRGHLLFDRAEIDRIKRKILKG